MYVSTNEHWSDILNNWLESMRVIRVPLSFEIKQEWPLRTSVLRQLLWSLSFRLFENMVICNARNNPCPLSHNARFFFLKNLSFILSWPLYNHFDIHCIFKLCFTFLTDLFWNWRKVNKFTYSVNVPFLPFSDNHLSGFKLKKFFGIRDIIISEY